MDIIKYIEKQQEDEQRKYFKYGEDYYNQRNTAIMSREKKVFMPSLGVTSNPFMANHQIPSGYFKEIVDQKVAYLLGNGTDADDNLDNYVEETFDEFLLDCGYEASKKALTWAYFYKDNNNLKMTMIPPEQCFPVYDEYGKLEMMARKFNSMGKEVLLVYKKESIERFEKEERGQWHKVYEKGHYTTKTMYQGQPTEEVENSFGEVPFIPLYNNKQRLSDLYGVKRHIDIYDIINSDFANNIDDMQDAFFVLKGYTGDKTSLKEFMEQLKQIKAVPVGEGGDVTAQQLQIPVEARKTFLELIDKDIFKFSMSVDMTMLATGDVTNEGIRAMMMNLDLKTDQFESEIRRFIKKVIEFINKHDNKSFNWFVNFKRSTIVNEKDKIESLVQVSPYITQETLLKLLPIDIDVKEEMKLIEKEKALNPIRLGDADDSQDE